MFVISHKYLENPFFPVRERRAVFPLVFQFGALQIRTVEMFSDFFHDPGRDHHLHFFVYHAAVHRPITPENGLDHFVTPLSRLKSETNEFLVIKLRKRCLKIEA